MPRATFKPVDELLFDVMFEEVPRPGQKQLVLGKITIPRTTLKEIRWRSGQLVDVSVVRHGQSALDFLRYGQKTEYDPDLE